ncbi:Lsr2 family protein, partial [Kibdelosporangium lantanae]
MAQKTVVELVDDLDGGIADETVAFTLDGVEFQIDLSAENAARLRDSLAAYVAHARRIGGRKQRLA